jgi:CDP-paratose 2-epimerase
VVEAIALCQEIAGRELERSYSPLARVGDHRWWISDMEAFKRDHPGWRLSTAIRTMLQEIHDHNAECWRAERDAAAA